MLMHRESVKNNFRVLDFLRLGLGLRFYHRPNPKIDYTRKPNYNYTQSL